MDLDRALKGPTSADRDRLQGQPAPAASAALAWLLAPDALALLAGAATSRAGSNGHTPGACVDEHAQTRQPTVHDLAALSVSQAILDRLATIIDSFPLAIVGVSPAGVIETWNDSATQLYGHRPDEALGTPIALLAPDGRSDEPQIMLAAPDAQTPFMQFETVRRHKDGHPLTLAITLAAIRDGDGTLRGTASIAWDISDRASAETALRESERKYRLLFEHMTAVYALCAVIVDEYGRPVDYRHLEVNPAYTRLTGIPAAAVLGKTVKEVLPGTDQHWIEEVGRVALTGEPAACRAFIADLGKYYDGFAFSPAAGQVALVFTDITERKLAEMRLAEQDAAYRRIVELAQEGILMLDARDHIIFVNQRMADLHGYTRDELQGHLLYDFLDDDVARERKTALDRRRSGEMEPWQFEVPARRKDGSTLWLLASAVGITDEHGQYSGSFALVTDISERRRAEEEVRRASRALGAITACNQAIARETDEGQLLTEICEAIVASGSYVLAWVGYAEHDEQRSVTRMASAGPATEYAQALTVSWAEVPSGLGPAGQAIRTGTPIVLEQPDMNPLFAPWVAAARQVGIGATMGVPLSVEGTVIGALVLYAGEPDAFGGEEHQILARLAADLSHAITARRARAERHRATCALRASEARFRASFEQASVGMIRAGSEDETLEVNDRLCRILGYSREELSHMSWKDVTHPDDQPASRLWHKELNAPNRENAWIEKRFLRKDGAVVWAIVSSSPVYDDDGTFLFRITAIQDITSQKQAQLALADSEARFRAMFEQAGVGIAVSDATGTWRLVNARQAELLGYEPQELQGRHFRDFLHAEEREADEHLDQRLRAGVISRLEIENRYRHRSGQDVWMRVSVGNIVDAGGTYQGAVAVFQDISARKEAEEAVRRAAAENALLAAAVENTSVGVLVTNATRPDHPIVYANQAFLRLSGYAEHEVLGRNPTFLQGAGTSPTALRAQLDALASGRAFADTLLSYRKDGTPIWCELRITPIRDAQGTLCNFVALVTDVGEQMRMQAEVERLALHDHLTGLPNRALLFDRTTQAILQADLHHQQTALLLLDLDHFKEVNDTFGHAVGDTLLLRVTDLLCSSLRTTDTVARLGGDEFAVLLPATDAQGAVEAAAALQQHLRTPVQVGEHTLVAEASIGIALAPEHGTDAAALLQHADVALYQAKRARRTASIYQPDQDLHTPDRAALREDVRHAIDRGQLRLHYQPLVQLASGAVTAVEALLRWEHPRRGLLYPDAFLPLVEEGGLQVQVTRWVLAEALRQQRAWRARGLDLALNVNLAASDLRDGPLMTEIATMLLRQDHPARLCLELTEGVLLFDLAHTRTVLLRLAAAGAQIAIDDYGTGYSSLSRLARLPVDQLKIDRMFVQGMVANPVEASIVASTVGLAHSVGVPVVAEGVEDETTLLHLRVLGCDLVQGYVYTRPLPPAEFERWLRSRRRPEGYFDR